jgi:type IV pilus assembly protein PilW
MKNKMRQESGLTLIEIMVSMVISSLVIGGIYGVYTIQQRSYTVQEQVAEMQQRIRSGLEFMMKEMRSAGYSPGEPYDVNDVCRDVAIKTMQADSFVFEYCDIEKSGTDYTAQVMQSSYLMQDTNSDGINDALYVQHNSGGTMPLVEGVDAVEFQYLDEDWTVTAVPADVRAVRISLLVRASYPDPRYTDTIKYVPASGATDWDINGSIAGSGNPANDHYHRRLLITSVNLRNMGLED